MSRLKVLVTGATGQVGYMVYSKLMSEPERYEVYGIDKKREPSQRVPGSWDLDLPQESFGVCDLSDYNAVAKSVEGMDVVAHLGADPEGREWESVRDNNVIGTYNVFEASRQANVKRIVGASSIMVSEGHREQEPYAAMMERRHADIPDQFDMISPATPAEPRGIYAASKVWLESLARVYSHRYDMSCLCIRIGQVERDRPRPPQGADIYVSQRDITQIWQRAIDAPEDVRFGIFYGMSDNQYRWTDIDDARSVLGYAPEDRAEDAHDYDA